MIFSRNSTNSRNRLLKIYRLGLLVERQKRSHNLYYYVDHRPHTA